MPHRPIKVDVPGANYHITIVGHRPTPLRDFYHALLRLNWGVTIATVSGIYLGANAIFALGYLLVGGIAHAAPGSFLDAFYFSVQTMGTIGYGSMFPETPAANALVVAESLVGLTLTALATGLVFAKFSHSKARIVFSREATITPMNGAPTLSFRIGNERGNQIVDVSITVVLMRTEITKEGNRFYRNVDLPLSRGRALSLSRSWTAMHVIDETSPLHGATPESLVDGEAEVQVLVVGLDDTLMQPIHAQHRYYAHELLFGMRHVDVLTEAGDGNLVVDLTKFHDTEPTLPSLEFPFPRP